MQTKRKNELPERVGPLCCTLKWELQLKLTILFELQNLCWNRMQTLKSLPKAKGGNIPFVMPFVCPIVENRE